MGSWSVWKIQHHQEEDRKPALVSTFIAFSGMKLTGISLLFVLPFYKRKGFELILSSVQEAGKSSLRPHCVAPPAHVSRTT